MKKIGTLFLCLAVFLLACAASAAGAAPERGAASSSMPEQAQLTADKMLFESGSGEFTATGNVVIRAEGAVFRAPLGTGNVKSKEAHFSDGITASGNWRGDKLDFSAGQVSFFFGQTPTYIAEGKVKGVLGKIYLDADKLYMKGTDFSALKVRRCEDRERDFAFGADSVKGIMKNGVVTAFTAQDKVWLNGRPNSGGDAVDIKGDKAVYAVERGSVIITGNVRAVQKGRVLTAGSLVYFPATNRIDAYGASEGPASITIDMNQENQEGRQ